MDDTCCICGSRLPGFLTTPLLESPDGSMKQCCENCSDEYFPGWDEEDEETDVE